MSQSRFSIVLVGVSALLRRPLVSRLRPADGERSSWVVFAARVGRFESGFRSASWPSGSLLPLFGMHRFGVAAGRVGLRAHRFRFSACADSEWPLGELAFGLTTSAFRHAPLRGCPRRVDLRAPVSEIAARRVGLRAHRFRFLACADPHRRAADARADGAHRHDTCFTSKHLSQHVNLPHRSPQALQNRQTPLLSPTRHPRG